MKPYLLSAILILFLLQSASAQSKSKPVLVSGSIQNLTLDSIVVRNVIDNSMKKIGVNKDGSFKGSLIVPEGYYNLTFQNEYTNIYLQPGFDLKISADMENLNGTISYSGDGANENNYLAKKLLATEEFKKSNPAFLNEPLSEDDFLKKTNGLFEIRNNLLSKTTGIGDNFKYLEQNSNELERRAELFNYPMRMRYQMGKPDFNVSANYPDAFKDLDVNNERFLAIPIYGQVVLNYVYIKNSEKMKAGNYSDMPTEMMVTLDSMVTNKKVKEFMAAQAGIQLIENSKTPEKFYTQYISMVKDEVYLKPVRDKYVAMKSMEKGMPSPDFSFADMTGKLFSLKDFKGKYIYIDVWATWCGPCKVEIPFLKTLEEELHEKNIAFVSICTFDEKSKWEAMVKEKDLKGIQLFAPRDNDFVKKYNIQGIPRFLIIDKEGKILDSNAKRPSDPTLKNDLLGLP